MIDQDPFLALLRYQSSCYEGIHISFSQVQKKGQPGPINDNVLYASVRTPEYNQGFQVLSC